MRSGLGYQSSRCFSSCFRALPQTSTGGFCWRSLDSEGAQEIFCIRHSNGKKVYLTARNMAAFAVVLRHSLHGVEGST